MWMSRDGNYWGHNAIIRTRAFAAHCGLPDLKGKPPFRRPCPEPRLRRGGADATGRWTVYMLPDLIGSYEEAPPR